MSDRDQDALSPEAGIVRPGGRKKFSDETWALAEADYMAGATAREVSDKYGMAMHTLYVHVRAGGKRKKEGRAPPAPLSESDVAGLIREIIAEGCAGAADRLLARAEALGARKIGRDRAGRDEINTFGPRKLRKRVHHAKELWEQMRRDYEMGDHTKPAIAERYGANLATVIARAGREKWSKTYEGPVLPLTQPDDPAQIVVAQDGEATSKWPQIAHAAQLPPQTPWRTWLFQGGRGAGKTRAGAEWLRNLAETTPNGIFAIVGATENDVRRVMIDGPSGLMSLPGRKPVRYEPSLRKITWRENGAIAHVFSAEEPDRLRGPQFMAAWADEFAAWRKPDHTLAMLRMGLRLKGLETGPRLVITTTPRPIPSLRKLHAEASCEVTRAPTSANAAHLHPDFLVGLGDIYGGTRLESQELMGELLDGEGALWRREWIVRGERPAKFDRVIVAVDPPASMGGVCGIVAAARLGERGFVLEDASIAGASPAGWARRVAETARRHRASRIVVETNQGGDMVSAVLAVEAPPCPVGTVHAHLTKRARAEPIAALYEKGRIAHCSAFNALEEEMMALGSEEEARLDRVDALVWALTDLLLAKRSRPGIISY
jgi:phage terminase large subunit-like protein